MRFPETDSKIFVIEIKTFFFGEIFAKFLENAVVLIRASQKRCSKSVESFLFCERGRSLQSYIPANPAPRGFDVSKEINGVVSRNK